MAGLAQAQGQADPLERRRVGRLVVDVADRDEDVHDRLRGQARHGGRAHVLDPDVRVAESVLEAAAPLLEARCPGGVVRHHLDRVAGARALELRSGRLERQHLLEPDPETLLAGELAALQLVAVDERDPPAEALVEAAPCLAGVDIVAGVDPDLREQPPQSLAHHVGAASHASSRSTAARSSSAGSSCALA